MPNAGSDTKQKCEGNVKEREMIRDWRIPYSCPQQAGILYYRSKDECDRILDGVKRKCTEILYQHVNKSVKISMDNIANLYVAVVK